jgi:hypothetical protein
VLGVNHYLSTLTLMTPDRTSMLGLHLASIETFDSALCLILAAMFETARVFAREPVVSTIFHRIHRNEAGHVRLPEEQVGAKDDLFDRTKGWEADARAGGLPTL